MAAKEEKCENYASTRELRTRQAANRDRFIEEVKNRKLVPTGELSGVVPAMRATKTRRQAQQVLAKFKARKGF